MNAAIKLLLVEDNELDQFALMRAVESGSSAYNYAVVTRLSEACEQLAAQQFDIIICEYRLSDGTALELLESRSDIPLIVITGVGDAVIAVNMLKAGAKDYLVKDAHGDYLKMLPRAVDHVLHRVQLERAEREQRTFADTLYDMARILNSTLDLDKILKLILENIKRIIPHDSANIMLIDDTVARVVQYNGWSSERVDTLTDMQFIVKQVPHLNLMSETQHSCIINDVPNYNGWVEIAPGHTPLSYLAAPICAESEVLGFLNLDSLTLEHFTADHARRLQAFVNHAAIAIKNAQLYKQSQEVAALQERQRLARDLHDSVTQTLFAASVTANAIVKQWNADCTVIGDDLVELRDLTQGALAEMRTLLLELRPSALLETNLADLLRQLAETVKGRARLSVAFTSSGYCALPPPVQIAFFRIAQESLNNVIKHARAKQLGIELNCNEHEVAMLIYDDGRGFDPSKIMKRQFGLKIMRERAAEAGITLQVLTKPDYGTTVRAVWLKEDGS